MPRIKVKNSRRDFIEKGYFFLRVCINKSQKEKLEKIKKSNEFSNLDLTIQYMIDNWRNKK